MYWFIVEFDHGPIEVIGPCDNYYDPAGDFDVLNGPFINEVTAKDIRNQMLKEMNYN